MNQKKTIIKGTIIFTGRGAVCLWGGPEFFGVVKGGNQFFPVSQRRGPKFFEGQGGGGDQNFFSKIFGAFGAIPSYIHYSKIFHAFGATFLFTKLHAT